MTKLIQKTVAVLLVACTTVSSSGCATLITGTQQTIKVDVQPAGSEITLYSWSGEVIVGPIKSPATVKIHRPKLRKPNFVVVSKEGSCPKYWVTKTSLSSGGTLSAIFVFVFLPLGFFGWVVDASNGSAFEFDESQFSSVTLQEGVCQN